MPLMSIENMLQAAKAGGYAVGAFNIENMEMAQAVIEAAEASGAPVILQTTSGTLKYAPPAVFAGMVIPLAQAAKVPVALHLDHGDSEALACKTVEAGYTSVMIDGSKLPLDENIALTRRVVSHCRAKGVPVEGELGRVGGKEDDHAATAAYTDPEEAVRFVLETGVSSLAIGIGTAHGIYREKPRLNIPLVATLRGCIDVPLVLHGASGLTDEDVRACIDRGICKVNFATELRVAYTAAVRAYLLAKPDALDPKALGKAGRDAVRALVMERIAVLGSAGKGGAGA